MPQKQLPCCARAQKKLHEVESDLAHAAHMAVRRPESARWQARIAEAKVAIARAKANIVDHEAQHAGEDAA